MAKRKLLKHPLYLPKKDVSRPLLNAHPKHILARKRLELLAKGLLELKDI